MELKLTVLLMLGATNIYKNKDNKLNENGLNPELISIIKKVSITKNNE